ncbi:MAG: DNA repair exonuclease [Oscillospiraceae bacterium]|nr:DNA repair exonuclease [Oscillospiraceae bacterium]
MKILHSADWHLDAPLSSLEENAAQSLRREMKKIPEKIASLCKQEQCDLMLLTGDLFDGAWSKQTLTNVKEILGSLKIPVIITPGNHDFCAPGSPYLEEQWPENVHIFKKSQIESIVLPELDCRIYGGGYEAMDCPGLLKRFRAEGQEKWHIGALHAEAGNVSSTYCPITKYQVQESGLDYLALGHIHKQGSLPGGETVCVWPGCPMGHGFDETGEKGVIIATLEDTVSVRFVMLDTPRFYDEDVDVSEDATAALAGVLPAVESGDFYRVTLSGYSSGLELEALQERFSHIPNLLLRDETQPEVDLWGNTDQDSLEGLLFSALKETVDGTSEEAANRALLAARICRRILDGQEVKLP